MAILLYTIAFDSPGSRTHRVMAKMLLSSLLRTHFSGELIVFHNNPDPIFRIARCGVTEIFIEEADGANAAQVRDIGQTFKYLARNYIDAENYERIIFLDCDCVVMRNIDHLIDSSSWDIIWQPEVGHSFIGDKEAYFSSYLSAEDLIRWGGRTPSNSGSWGVRAKHYNRIMSEWESLDREEPLRRKVGDQPAWNRLLLTTDLKTQKFERGEIAFPTFDNVCWNDYKNAAILHFAGGPPHQKLPFMASTYLGKYFSEHSGIWLDFLEP